MSRWQCYECGSLNVQISLPTWYRESADGELTMVETDAEADVMWWYCEDCEATGTGEPNRAAESATGAQVTD